MKAVRITTGVNRVVGTLLCRCYRDNKKYNLQALPIRIQTEIAVNDEKIAHQRHSDSQSKAQQKTLHLSNPHKVTHNSGIR